MKKSVSFNDLTNEVKKLSKQDFNKLVTSYLKENGGKASDKYNRVVLLDLESKLVELGINNTCPKCGSKRIVLNGKRENGIQRLKCNECNNRFTYFTGTILEKTKYHWDLWIDVVYMMLNNMSLDTIVNNLINNNACPSITEQTVFHWRHKIMDACKAIEQPKLHGVVQIDETHLHESQKGSNQLIDLFNGGNRTPRRQARASKYGPMGAEFATIITAIDSSSHVVTKFPGLGKFDLKTFEALFAQHIEDTTILCTDANEVYIKYSQKYRVRHYVRPSDYLDKIKKCKSQDEIEDLYDNDMLDYMANNLRHRYTFKQITDLKKQYNLNLSFVNSLHNTIKGIINGRHRGVSTKYVESYMAWITLTQNYRADHGKVPPTTRKDAEEILCFILKAHKNILIKDLREIKVDDIPKPNRVYLNNLKKKTDQARSGGRTKFIFDSETTSDSISIDAILREMPIYRLKQLAKENKIKGYTCIKRGHTFKYIQELKKIPNIHDIVLEFCAQYGLTTDDERDL